MKNYIIIFIVVLISSTIKIFAQSEYNAHDALQLGYVDITAKASNGYSKTEIFIKNKTNTDFVIDFSETCFIPKNSNAQRIGLTWANNCCYKVNSYAGKSGYLDFESRCLDHSRSAPSNGQEYYIATASLPSYISSLLRVNASQVDVWAATESPSWKEIDPRNDKSFIFKECYSNIKNQIFDVVTSRPANQYSISYIWISEDCEIHTRFIVSNEPNGYDMWFSLNDISSIDINNEYKSITFNSDNKKIKFSRGNYTAYDGDKAFVCYKGDSETLKNAFEKLVEYCKSK